MGGGWVNKCKAISFFLRALPRSRNLMDIKLRYIQSYFVFIKFMLFARYCLTFGNIYIY